MKPRLTLMLAVCAVGIATPVLANQADMDAKAKHYMTKIDTNGDSQISKDEHIAFGDKMFTEADTNSDGMISLIELTAHKKKEKEEMKHLKDGSENN